MKPQGRRGGSGETAAADRWSLGLTGRRGLGGGGEMV